MRSQGHQLRRQRQTVAFGTAERRRVCERVDQKRQSEAVQIHLEGLRLDLAKAMRAPLLTEGRHVFATANGQESYEWNLHAGQRPEGVPGRVADI